MPTFFIVMILVMIEEIVRGYIKVKNKKRYIIKTTIGIIIVALLFFLFGPLFFISPIKIGYSTLDRGNVVIVYPSSSHDLGQSILEQSKRAALINEHFYKMPAKTKVLVAMSDLDMLRFGSYPKANGAGLDLGVLIRGSKATENIIAHEMSHKNLRKITGKSAYSFPRWFDEGLASYLGNMDYYKTIGELKIVLQEGTYYRDITKWKGITGLIQWLNKTFWIKPNPRLIYGQTYLMVKHLFDIYGQEKVYEMIMLVKDTSFDKAFVQTFGISTEQFHQNFISFVENSE